VECPARVGENPQVLIDYCAGAVPADVAAELERHLEQCPLCREFCRAQARVWSELDIWEPAAVSASFDACLRERLAQDGGRRWKWIWKPAIPLAAVAAAILVVALWRGPAGAPASPITKKSESVDVEQVEKALEDIDMLKQLYLAPRAETDSGEKL